MNDAINRFSILALGLLFGIVVWIGSAAYDCYVLQIGTFLECLIAAPEPRLEIRVTAVLTGLLVGIGGQFFTNRMLASQRMKALFEHSNDGQILLEPDSGRILEVNRRIVDFLGYERSEILTMTLADFHPHDITTATEFLNRVLCDGTGMEDGVSCRRKDGTLMPAEVSAKAFQDGGRRYVVVSLRNISKRVLAQQEREMALREAQIANRAKSDFLAIMSHELRTPLNAVLGFSEMIAREQLGPIAVAAYRDYGGYIHHAGKHLLGIINDILDLARLERGKDPLAPEWTDLCATCETIVQMFTPAADEAGVILTYECEESGPGYWIDERKVKQIITNLISNSIKFTPDGGRITVIQRTISESEHVIEVLDTGKGMSQEQIENSFKPFAAPCGASPLRRGTSGAGIGLGLPLSRQLTEMLGGALEIESEIGRGTKVSVRLPIEKREVAPQRAHLTN
ncbi:MAG: hypothetical protein COW30_14790 [Rhodospirillales bacterium CG15_BIG_FIL_POST_REV_8_21_14_020_66_15]|nr:MAG: hypothetical protein COW30_14790 [Rhodospirillales bacterium CG15_BIG_FIL_POST_REV_8_21_14_020_66_15]